mgnify:CR=1 FL=1
MNEIYVVGHRNPDTDSIVAAMSYAALRNALGDRDYVAAYLGHVSDETQRLLNRFGFQPPQLIQNVRTQVSDLDYDTPPALNATVTMDRAWHIMREQRISAIPVVNEDGTLYGTLSNGLVALSGALLCQYQGYADINMGRGAVVIGLAAVVIGEAVVKHISPNFAVRLTGVLVGAVIYYLVYQVIIFVGFDTDLLKMFSALVVAAFLGVPYVKKQLARKHHVKGGIRHA